MTLADACPALTAWPFWLTLACFGGMLLLFAAELVNFARGVALLRRQATGLAELNVTLAESKQHLDRLRAISADLLE